MDPDSTSSITYEEPRYAQVPPYGEPAIEFELSSGHYVCDWYTDSPQNGLLLALQQVGTDLKTPAFVSSARDYPGKTQVKLEEALGIDDRLDFLAVEDDEYSITLCASEEGYNVEFSSERRNLDTLMELYESTMRYSTLPPVEWGELRASLAEVLSEYSE